MLGLGCHYESTSWCKTNHLNFLAFDYYGSTVSHQYEMPDKKRVLKSFIDCNRAKRLFLLCTDVSSKKGLNMIGKKLLLIILGDFAVMQNIPTHYIHC